LDLYEDVKWPLAAVVVLMNLSVVLERIPLAMGRSKIILAMGLMGSWVGQVRRRVFLFFLFVKSVGGVWLS
jgi:hypothetical protein